MPRDFLAEEVFEGSERNRVRFPAIHGPKSETAFFSRSFEMSEKSESYPLALPVAQKPYRTLLFFAAYGKVVAYLAGAGVCAGGVALWEAGFGAAWVPAGVVLGGFTLLMMTCVAELIDLIVDTMIPK